MSTYSLCVSNWNSANTVQQWASSLLSNLSDEDEVIIVDGLSTDGSQEFLRRLCKDHEFKFASMQAHLGRQRQRALLLSGGEYVIYTIDTDDIVISLQEAKRLYREAIEWDPVTGKQRAFRCVGFFIIPRWMLEAIGGYPDLQYYEDQLVAYRLASRNQLTASWKVAAVKLGTDPKKRRLPFRLKYSFLRVRDGLRIGMFDARNIRGALLLPPAWLASLRFDRHEFRRDWWNFDVNRDEYVLEWIRAENLSRKPLLEDMEIP